MEKHLYQLRFEPGKLHDGKIISVWVNIPFIFILSPEDAAD
ncbi:MAG: hypothetical protein AAGN35_05865 [Bacteroidota bacterium]